ncbi:hypothetical protein SKAU_G00110570 [Synaphobranchus kaupii]|uniref:Uncharacterized protein n=1 Tax=Synaphobranchus kaupii TaxID=118154 RepID=A0A9Q1J819_SYNKA|nr:hypothetical protein SKAU_G00110570 [Synaphobranchus kaupii]
MHSSKRLPNALDLELRFDVPSLAQTEADRYQGGPPEAADGSDSAPSRWEGCEVTPLTPPATVETSQLDIIWRSPFASHQCLSSPESRPAFTAEELSVTTTTQSPRDYAQLISLLTGKHFNEQRLFNYAN